MRFKKCCSATWLVALLMLCIGTSSLYAQQTSTISGVVTDANDGQPLAGATILLSVSGQTGIVGGDAADINGGYSIQSVAPGSYTLVVRYLGYNEYESDVNVTAGQNVTLNVALSQGGVDLNTIIISASRQAEKVLDAPASISVIDAREVEQDVVQSTVGVLRNTTGVDVAQTGVDRSEVVLRGFNNAFGGSAYILTDYRQAAVPSLNANIHSIMPNMPIDIERIEVVRGPGSALYGPGVDEGVIHYLTKDPFSYPGTTISITGGERSLFGGQFRHAGVIGSDLGYKVTGYYSQAEDWELDTSDPIDNALLAVESVPRDYDFSKMNVNGMLTYRINDGVSITANGGYSELNAIVLSGIGTLQADGFSNAYGQLRLQANRFFGQAYFSNNDAGNSLVYGTGLQVVDKGTELNLQAQYDFDLAAERVSVIVGGDYQSTRPDTEGTILGRNEEDDEINELGGYAQSTIAVTDKFDMTLALRGDWSNIFDFQVSPRAAFVYKATPQNTFRATYNRSFSSPGSNSLFLDIQAQTIPLDATRNFIFYGRGSAEGVTFNNFASNNTAQMLLPVDGFFGGAFNVDAMPLIPIYGAAAAGIVPLLMDFSAPLPDDLPPLTDQQRELLANLLGFTAQTGLVGLGSTTSPGSTVLGIPDASERGFREVSGPIDIEPLRQTITQTIEVGYKGVFNNQLLVAIDGYYANKKDFTGPLLVESPLVYTQFAGLANDVGTALGTSFATSANPTVSQLLTGLAQTGIDANTAVSILAGLVGGAFNDTQIASIQPDQSILPDGTTNTVGGFLGYRNFGNINYWGIDASFQYLASSELTLFGNMSVVSDDFFDNEELDETNTDLSLALNAPTFKVKMGGSYRLDSGLSLSASGRYTEGFPVLSGPYVGNVDSYFLVDLGAGYDFQNSVPGLRIDFSLQNVLNNEHREFVGAPQLGRMGLLRLTYSIQ